MDIKNPPPLAFDKLLEGRSISAYDSSLFKLPLEILTYIARQLPTSKTDLASLALVNTDCRQLARSCQFRTIKFDGSRSSEDLLGLLWREAVERSQNRGRTRHLSLGACVRRVVTNNDGYWKEIIASRPLKPGRSIEDNLDDPFDDDEEKIALWRPTVGELTKRLNQNYRPNILFVISSLVHLESFDINQVDWNQTYLNTLVALPVKYLSLGEVQMTDIIPIMNIVDWPLEKLTIRLSWDFDYRTNSKESVLNSSKSWELLLRSCAPFLQVLNLSHSSMMALGFKEELISFVLEFPKLRQLNLLWESNFGPLALRSLILTSPYLKTLSINYGDDNTRHLLDNEGHIESLKTLILNQTHREFPADMTLNFLKMNLQLEGLGFYSAESYTLLDYVLLLFKEGGNLKELSMIWSGLEIPESSLRELASLTLIENLHLSSGNQVGWRNNWLVDHLTLLENLKPLKRLRRLAFTRDAYSYTRYGSTHEYSSYKDLRVCAWDDHCQNMRKMANAYACAFKNLKLLHIGEITYEIYRVEKNIELIAIDDERFSWEAEILNINP